LAFLGWHSAWRALSFLNKELAETDEVRRGLEADLPALAKIMYPPTAFVEEEIENFKAARLGGPLAPAGEDALLDSKEAASEGRIEDPSELPTRWSEIIDRVAGFKRAERTTLYDRVKRGLNVPIALLNWEHFAMCLNQQKDGPALKLD